MNSMSRRSMMIGGTALAGAAAVSFSQLFGVLAQASRDDKQTMLNLAVTAEIMASTHYYTALTSGGIAFDETQTAYLKAALVAELAHVQFLVQNGGQPVAGEFYFPTGTFTDPAIFAQTTEAAEAAFVGAYLAATRRLSELGEPLLAMIFAQIAGVEAQHLAVARQSNRKLPNSMAFAAVPFFNASDATPLLKPFLDGGDGFEGPIAFPGMDAFASIIAETQIEIVPPAGTPAEAQPPEGTPQNPGTAAATPVPAASACTVTASLGRNVNVRSGPGTTYGVVGILPAGGTASVDGITTDAAGFIWFRAVGGGWIRSDTVTAEPECAGLPQV